MKNRFLTPLLFVGLLGITACGGGGSGSSSKIPSSSLSATDVSNELENTLQETEATGIIINSAAIEGLSLRCGTQKTRTQKNGTFICEKFPLSAYLGEFKIGEVAKLPADKIIYTQDLMGVARGATTHPEVTKISMLLQSLDEDATPLNGITLSADSLELLSSYLRSDSVLEDMSYQDITNIINTIIERRASQDANAKLVAVDAEDAQLNLTTMTAQTPAPTYAQRSSGRLYR